MNGSNNNSYIMKLFITCFSMPLSIIIFSYASKWLLSGVTVITAVTVLNEVRAATGQIVDFQARLPG
ncbi:hypothetical protein AAFF_G00043120 [Aldrovandia affinis]|uniref:Uncharacterized protein n=1 Tax=Aldrovandia affinis TaxID=143900 RepID=A0AAD7S2F0_9TELE|nr:hypothetical protein AAFF_G00043120 [Aldrovandia affinis]